MSKNVIFAGAVGAVCGFVVGVVASRHFFDSKYAEIAENEIASVREKYHKKYIPVEDVMKANEEYENSKIEVMGTENEYERVVQEYCTLSGKKGEVTVREDERASEELPRIFVIDYADYMSDLKDPVEGVAFDDDTLTYFFPNDIVVNDMNDVVDRIEFLGNDREIFRPYLVEEMNTVYVRNRDHHMDYEVLLINRFYDPDIDC